MGDGIEQWVLSWRVVWGAFGMVADFRIVGVLVEVLLLWGLQVDVWFWVDGCFSRLLGSRLVNDFLLLGFELGGLFLFLLFLSWRLIPLSCGVQPNG